ncbi:MAG TPA: M48 family metallopeptidase [Verrucomicrobiota bacterium]|nr:M48 family metallopeptidase [Verrucomicrobiota bacterium]
MDFFGQQARAKTRTTRLLALFFLAVALTNFAVYSGIAAVLRVVFLFTARRTPDGALVKLVHHFGADGFWNWELLGWVTLFVTTVIVVVSCWKFRQLSHGGSAVAQLLGGRPLPPDTSDPEERRLLNVVEEMAIASGIPVPEVYLLEEEIGINAFAAGNDVSDSAVGVTFGALKLLTRDEMQGVIAHEFSHILNGDMRLNTRLIGWLHGVLALVVIGRILTLRFLSERQLSDGSRVGPVFHPAFLPAFVLGTICIVAGTFGAFFARCIKSTISRQREHLADADAVQFTRNPEGLAGALKKIGGLRTRSLIAAARAEEASHMYFGDGMRPRWFGFLSTHPPLADRVRRLEPQFDGRFPPVSLTRALRESPVTELYRREGAKPVDFNKLASVIGPQAAAQEFLYSDAAVKSIPVETSPPAARTPFGFAPVISLEFTRVLLGTIPEELRRAADTPFSAAALVYALLCGKDITHRDQQLRELETRSQPGIAAETRRLLPLVNALDAGHYLPLADLSVRTLRALSPEQFENFHDTLDSLVAADSQIDLFEYMLQRMVLRHLTPHFRPTPKTPVQYYALKPLIPDCAVLLSGLARIGNDTDNAVQSAFRQGAALLETSEELFLLPHSKCNLPQMDAALARIAQATPAIKHQILTALTVSAAVDGLLQRREAELLRAIADAMGVNLPPILGDFPEQLHSPHRT